MVSKYHIILASNSPRRKELLQGLDVPFTVSVLPGIEETYPDTLPAEKVPEYIAKEKAAAYKPTIAADALVITADTVVILDSKILGKPADDQEARQMLRFLSGRTHKVITGVCLTTAEDERSFSVETEVTFKALTDGEIDYYVSHYHPTDKAGAYGIQEWIGHIGVTALKGSYFNVMGLPVARIYEQLANMGIQF